MARLYSNELRAVVIPDNFLENTIGVLKENCLTVQHFDYQCEHKRNQSGEVYGATDPVLLKFTIRINSPRHAKPFYRELISNDHANFSFLFNAIYNNLDRLSDYEDGMVVNAYVVHVEEEFKSPTKRDSQSEQILLTVTLQVRSVKYLGRENHYTNTFIQ